jgi:alpha-methylacyl-CoA racemase
VAALEPHFLEALGEAMEMPRPTVAGLAKRFVTEDAAHWEAWARTRDLPIAALRDPSPPES